MDAEQVRRDYISRALDGLRRDRRALHRIPELGHTEFKTQRYILNSLRPLAPDALHPIADTGVRCVFMGRAPLEVGERRRTIALRADMDALNVAETTGLDFCSERPGFMHACGHDGHMATMLAVARFCAEQRDHLRCNVTILFQPAEELDGGADA